jgi:O-antigen/teichoic acid export membrane protein
MVGFGIASLFGVVGVAALTRHLAPADYGRYSVVQALLAIVAGVAEAGLVNIGIAEYTSRRGADRDATFRNIQGMRIAAGALGMVVALAFGVVAGYPGVMLTGTILMGTATVLLAVQTTLAIPLIAGLRWGWATAFDVARQAVQVALFLVLVAAGAKLLPFYAVGIPVGIVVLVANLLLVRGRAPLLPAFEWERWRPLLKLVAPYAAAVAVASVYVSVASVTMSLVASPTEVGWFSAPFRIYLVIAGIPTLLVGAAFPILTRTAGDDPERHGYATNRMLVAMLIAGAWAAMMTAVLARRGIDVVAGGGYEPSVPVLRIQAIAVFAGFVTVTVGTVLISMRRFGDLLRTSAIALVVSVVVTLALVDSQGAQAGGIANAAAETLSAVAATWFLLRAQRHARFPLSLLPRLALAAALAGAVALAPVADFVQAAGMTIVFFAALHVMHAIPDELLDVIPGLRR